MRPPQFERNIWSEALFQYRENLSLILRIIVVLFALELTGLGYAGALFLWSMLLVQIQGSILNGRMFRFGDLMGCLRPILFLLVALLALPLLVFAIILVSRPTGQLLTAIALFLPYVLTAFLLALSCIAGTWLPAVVAKGGDRSFKAAIQRGRRTIGYTLLRLPLSCAVLLIAAKTVQYGTFLASSILLASVLGQTTGLAAFPIAMLTASVPYDLVVAYMVIVLAVIFARAYVIAEEAKARPFQ